ncbi:MAG: hypothetical protein FWE59_04600 [Oscillospiraceae bacterium]|nr:hypothetical protein [Oscillospiraceae bacterium]
MEGRSIQTILGGDCVLRYEQAKEVALRILRVLAPMHKVGTIHGGISPGKVFITDEGDVELLGLEDASWAIGPNKRLHAGYAAPEQYGVRGARGGRGPWSDVYAVAAVLYFMITGVKPPDAQARTVKDRLRRPSKLGADLPKGAEDAIMSALCLRLQDRTQNASAFAAVLQSEETGQTPARFAARRKATLIALVTSAISALALAITIALYTTGALSGSPPMPSPDPDGPASQIPASPPEPLSTDEHNDPIVVESPEPTPTPEQPSAPSPTLTPELSPTPLSPTPTQAPAPNPPAPNPPVPNPPAPNPSYAPSVAPPYTPTRITTAPSPPSPSPSPSPSPTAAVTPTPTETADIPPTGNTTPPPTDDPPPTTADDTTPPPTDETPPENPYRNP